MFKDFPQIQSFIISYVRAKCRNKNQLYGFDSGESLDKVSVDGFESMRDVPRLDEDELVSRESPSWLKGEVS